RKALTSLSLTMLLLSVLALSRSSESNMGGAILKSTTLMKLKPWRGRLRQNTHQFTSAISLTKPAQDRRSTAIKSGPTSGRTVGALHNKSHLCCGVPFGNPTVVPSKERTRRKTVTPVQHLRRMLSVRDHT